MALTDLDKRFPAIAIRLIGKYGVEHMFTKPEPPTAYNSTTGKMDQTDTEKNFGPVKMTPPFPQKTTLNGNEIVNPSTRVAYIQGQDLGFIPTVGFRITKVVEAGAQIPLTWTVTEVSEISSGELVAAYELEMRR